MVSIKNNVFVAITLMVFIIFNAIIPACCGPESYNSAKKEECMVSLNNAGFSMKNHPGAVVKNRNIARDRKNGFEEFSYQNDYAQKYQEYLVTIDKSAEQFCKQQDKESRKKPAN